MKKLNLILLTFLASGLSLGQSIEWHKFILPQTEESKAFHDDMVTDSEGNVYTIGYFEGHVDFDNESTDYELHVEVGGAISITKMADDGQIQWLKTVVCPEGGRGKKIRMDNVGNLYIAGIFSGTVDFNPNDEVAQLTVGNIETANGFLLCLTADGEFNWVKSIDSVADIGIIDFKIDNSGDLILLGEFDENIDCQGSSYLDTNGTSLVYTNYYLYKFSDTGNVLWGRFWSGYYGYLKFHCLTTDAENRIFLGGEFIGVYDFNPDEIDENVLTSSTENNREGFLLRISTDGQYQWTKKMSGETGQSGIIKLEFDESNNLILFGYVMGSVDVDFSENIQLVNSGSNGVPYHYFVLKTTPEGDFIWVQQIMHHSYGGGWAEHELLDLKIDSSGNIYFGLRYFLTLSIGFTPGIASISTEPNWIDDCAIIKLTSEGHIIWATQLGFSSTPFNGSLKIDGNGDVIVATNVGAVYSEGMFGEFTPVIGLHKAVIVKIGENHCSYFLIPIQDDTNSINCENPTGTIHILPTGGAPPFQYVWSDTNLPNDSIITVSQGGVYSVQVTDNNGCQKQLGVYVNAPTSLEGYDLTTSILQGQTQAFVTGMTTQINVLAANLGCSSQNGQLQFVLDDQASFVNSSIPPSLISGDTLFFDFESLNYQSSDVNITITVLTDTTAQMGDEVCFNTLIMPISEDFNPSNNSFTLCRNVQTSYDPNIKSVYPAGECEQHYVELDQKLTYTVQFQNTGTFAAINIAVMDTLSSLLDINTLRVIHSSHDMITEVYDDHILKFKFQNIYLADSASNEEESHGHIIFEIEPKSTIAYGSLVENNVAIYFDYNEPVITNTVFNTFVNSIPECMVSLNEIISTDAGLLLYPNPVGDMMTLVLKDRSIKNTSIRISDITGKVIEHKNHNVDGNIVFDTSALDSGVYVMTVMNGQDVQSIRFVKQ